ncbi:Hypothetical predicted protein [Paramuricea clavata]|uniref:Uncharacterized protein n=1 Tax=Paramuricea clavata TaxID=317549 RepID=A0A7D9DY57_PARCT|nr:Hypothetical predicted protein [Paramuricea clavata]
MATLKDFKNKLLIYYKTALDKCYDVDDPRTWKSSLLRSLLLSIGEMSTSSPSADGQSEVGQVFEQFKSYIDTRLSNLENSLQSANHDQPETNDIQASTRKLQREVDALKFKYKANAKQFIYNAEVEDLVGSTVEH